MSDTALRLAGLVRRRKVKDEVCADICLLNQRSESAPHSIRLFPQCVPLVTADNAALSIGSLGKLPQHGVQPLKAEGLGSLVYVIEVDDHRGGGGKIELSVYGRYAFRERARDKDWRYPDTPLCLIPGGSWLRPLAP